MMILKGKLFLLLLCLSLCSCTSTPNSNYGPRSMWITKLLKEPTCQPPCWENIIPGKMTMDEIYSILSKNPDILITEYQTEPIGPINNKNIFWDFLQTHDSGRASNDNQGETLETIGLYLGDNQLLTIQEVIDAYGPPTKVLLSACRDRTCVVDFAYTESGMSVSTGLLRSKYSSEKGYSVSVTQETKIKDFLFFPAGKDGFMQTLGVGSVYETIPDWNGYGKYQKTIQPP
jgi:hypothetical protein